VTKTEAKFRKFEEEEPKLATKKGGSYLGLPLAVSGVVTGGWGCARWAAGAAGRGSGLGRRAGAAGWAPGGALWLFRTLMSTDTPECCHHLIHIIILWVRKTYTSACYHHLVGYTLNLQTHRRAIFIFDLDNHIEMISPSHIGMRPASMISTDYHHLIISMSMV
jgi:hypothetical protein